MAASPDLPLDSLLTLARQDELRFSWVVPDGWHQGRGAFGGLVLGALVRALEAVAGPERPLRSLTAALPGPTLPGEVALRVEPLRTGSGVSTLAVRLEQNGEIQAHAVGVLGRTRTEDHDLVTPTPPARPDWRSLEPVPVEPPYGPEFGRHLEFRNAGALPFTKEPGPVRGWVRPKRAARCDAAWIVACVDAWWPAVIVHFDGPRPVGTVAFSLQLTDALEGLDPATPAFFTANAVAVRHGYAIELRELWSEDGRLLALNQQTIAIIR